MAKRKTRREFNKSLAALAAVPVVAAEAMAEAAQQPNPVPPAQALTDIVRARYGRFLNEDQLKKLREQLETGIRIGELLHRSPTTNADEPDFIFSADVL